jgi:hypothetical protein
MARSAEVRDSTPGCRRRLRPVGWRRMFNSSTPARLEVAVGQSKWLVYVGRT